MLLLNLKRTQNPEIFVFNSLATVMFFFQFKDAIIYFVFPSRNHIRTIVKRFK